MVLLVYLLGRRLGGPAVGLLAALLAAIYPAFIDNSEQFLSEPIAAFTLSAAVLGLPVGGAIPGRRSWAWLVPGALLGATALTRPEYLMFALFLGLVVLVAMARRRGVRLGVAGGGAVRGRVRARARALDGAQLRRARPLRAGHDRRRQGAVRRHLPARRRAPAAGEAGADPALRGQAGGHRPGGRRHPDEGPARQGRAQVPGPRARRRARQDRPRELPQVRARGPGRDTPAWS